MTYSEKLKKELKAFHLLDHPFYQDWNKGTLSLSTLKEYSKQYYHHVKAFPRYISATHSKCEQLDHRKVLLENLMDEEGVHGTSHPLLWKNFSLGLGVSEAELNQNKAGSSIQNVISSFLGAGNSSYEEGLASFYAYEYQVPEVATTKIKGLKTKYNIKDKNTLAFFSVHEKADVHHRKQCEILLNKIPKHLQEKATLAAIKSAKSLWDFLSDIHEGQNYAA